MDGLYVYHYWCGNGRQVIVAENKIGGIGPGRVRRIEPANRRLLRLLRAGEAQFGDGRSDGRVYHYYDWDEIAPLFEPAEPLL